MHSGAEGAAIETRPAPDRAGGDVYWSSIAAECILETSGLEVRRSVGDPTVLLFHRRSAPRWVCAVAKREGSDGFLITAYPADRIKQGEILWTK